MTTVKRATECQDETREILANLHDYLGEPAIKLAIAALVYGTTALIFGVCAANKKEG
jgi:hypothetical protein